MPLEAIQKRFIDEINARGYDDKYIDKNEEREILQIAIHQGFSVDAARAALAEACANQDYVLESDLMKIAGERCVAATAAGSKIDQAGFDAVLDALRGAAHGRRTDPELKKLIITAIEDHALKVKTGWLFNWYRGVRREVGMK